MSTRTTIALAAYMATIPAANWMIQNVGTQAFPGGPHTIPVGFGLSAPSGVLLIGVALAARDYLQRTAGKRAALLAIACGVALSYIVNPAIATASAAAFLLGELADFAVFTPLAARSITTHTTQKYDRQMGVPRVTTHTKTNPYRLALAVLASGVVGGIIDSLVFLQLAFGSTMYWQGQVVGKTLVALACALIVVAYRAVPVRLTAREA